MSTENVNRGSGAVCILHNLADEHYVGRVAVDSHSRVGRVFDQSVAKGKNSVGILDVDTGADTGQFHAVVEVVGAVGLVEHQAGSGGGQDYAGVFARFVEVDRAGVVAHNADGGRVYVL